MLGTLRAFSALLLAAQLALAIPCRSTERALPVPNLLASDPRIKALAASIKSALDDAVSTDPFVSRNTSSFSLVVTSKKETLFSYHHTAPVLAVPRKRPVDGSTVYRIASLSKVFTGFTAQVQKGLSLDDRLVKWVPELKRGPNPGGVQWEEITLRDLASHTSGLGRQYSGADIYTFVFGNPANGPPELYGLPRLNASDLPPCGKDRYDAVCTRKQFIEISKSLTPVFPPGGGVVYSNDGIIFLGLAVAAAAGKSSWAEHVSASVFKPLGMRNSFTSKPADELGVQPVVDPSQGEKNYWDVDHGIMAATGGLYSSADDLSIFLRSLLNNKFLTPVETRRWLKPGAFTAVDELWFGTPWEIERLRGYAGNEDRLIEVHGKDGSSVGYYAHFELIPEYDIGITVLSAGPEGARDKVKDIVRKLTIPALKKVAKEDAEKTYAGTYTGQNGANSSITLTIDDGPGLRITSLISTGKDLIASIGLLTSGRPIPNSLIDFRLFPTGVKSDGGESWRGTMLIRPDSCFLDLDVFTYGKRSLLEFVFVKERGGMRVLSPSLRAGFEKTG